MQNSDSIHKENKQSIEEAALQYIGAGVGCNAIVLLAEGGLLEPLLKKGYLLVEEIESHPKSIALRSAIFTLIGSKIVQQESNKYTLSNLGKAVTKHIGLIGLVFDGYGRLIAEQGKIMRNNLKNDPKNLMDGESISRFSIDFSRGEIYELLSKEINKLKLKGSICDLGCGYATMLTHLCKNTGSFGIGIDAENEVVKRAKKALKNENINVVRGDIFNLKESFPDVDLLISCYVLHDIQDKNKITDMFNCYREKFPNARYFFYVDIVAPSHSHPNFLPGFDYVHGLLNIRTRNYEETMEVIADSSYEIYKEVPINLPNTFLWILRPRHINKERAPKAYFSSFCMFLRKMFRF